MKKLNLFTIGEILMDMTPHQVDGKILYQANPGGAPFNVMKMAKKFNIEVGFAGKVGNDKFGDDLRELLIESKIDDTCLKTTSDFNTTLAFVHLDNSGERSFSFYRNNSADYQITPEDIELEKLKIKNFYFGSVALSRSPMKETIHWFLKNKRNDLDYVFFDPNYRPLIWNDSNKAIEEIQKVLKFVDVLKISEEEALWLTGKADNESSIDMLHNIGIKVIYLTMGEKGCLFSMDNKKMKIEAYKADKVIDTTGAGDAFFGAVIGYLLNCQKNKVLNREDFFIAGKHGCVAGGLCVENYGAVPSYPAREAIEDIIYG